MGVNHVERLQMGLFIFMAVMFYRSKWDAKLDDDIGRDTVPNKILNGAAKTSSEKKLCLQIDSKKKKHREFCKMEIFLLF